MHALLAVANSQPDNTVAIVAVAVSGAVGVLTPLVLSVAASRRTSRELDAAADRQREGLEEERRRLQASLDAEERRLGITIAGGRRAARLEAIRDVLDAGARLLATYRAATAELRSAAAEQPGRIIPTPRWMQVSEEVIAHRARLLLWFDPATEVVHSFDEVLKLTNYLLELRTGSEPEPEHQRLRPQLIERAEQDFEAERLRYLGAARTALASSSVE